ncbi:MAG: polyprenyl synthetase family protein [Deltaproteobacteria bacterium]|jgi:geranylgeranyl diphosphate synthase type II|nr:polyprenyl synthetase family protein [Deltaproteobacteria bacterium]
MADSCKEVARLRAARVEEYLAVCLRERGIPERLLAAMEYSLLAGGKRLRPVLCLSCAAMCGLEEAGALPFAASIELIHTYSLIHDDLPAMDNDDLRRGKPTNHRAFDEATAILAGDGLLTEAFVCMAGTPLPPERVLAALGELARAAGAGGMVGGQMLDMECTGAGKADIRELAAMHARKTGALLKASCLCGGLLAGADAGQAAALARYGAAFGAAFQIVDDMLDVTGTAEQIGKTPGKDSAQGKLTYPSLLGLERSRELALEQAGLAQASLAAFSGPEAEFLRRLALAQVERIS